MPPGDNDASNRNTQSRPDLTAKELEHAQASWKRAAGLELPADACNSWVRKTKPSLYWIPLFSTDPLESRLAQITAALDAGADPNALDHELNLRRGLGRPLHCCLGGHMSWGPPEVVRHNLPLIELLLSRGADPRLDGPTLPPLVKPSPLELAREEAENTNPDDVGVPFLA